jgi:hypothetical protein
MSEASDSMSASKPARACVGVCGRVWACVGVFGRVWACLGVFERVWMSARNMRGGCNMRLYL